MILAIDMGGTHIDGVLVRQGALLKSVKHELERNDLFGSIWRCLQDLLEDQEKSEITRIHLSTTVCTNAIVEGKVSRVGVIVQSGPGINWDFDLLGNNLYHLSGSSDHRGIVTENFRQSELQTIRARFQDRGVESLAVISKFSPRNPDTEKKIGDFFADEYKEITLGHKLSGKLNFPRRVQTAYLNAAVADTFRTFAESIQEALAREAITAPVYILKADGGTVDLDSALKRPVETILSGPAASYVGITALFPVIEDDAILVDIGGTSTDIFFLAAGLPLFEAEGIEIDGRKTLVRAVFSKSVGLGGDSFVRSNRGEIRIGPARRGPAVAFGGDDLTPTDALVYLGLMRGKHPQKAEEALAVFAAELGLDTEACARKIVTLFCDSIMQTIDSILARINSSPVYTIRDLLAGRRITPGSIKLIGGPAKALAEPLHQASGLEINFPENYEIANALGAALARPTTEISLYANTERRILSIPELGIYESIDKSFTLEEAEEIALKAVSKAGTEMGLQADQIEAEITESSSFNMVRGFMGRERNIRVRAQIKPGLLYELQLAGEGGRHES
ncbi:MAG: hydantoinase/oxoprolinase family protein [Clostridiaceae bacterium]|nr:hydantoinase/oxoprolinase family protein [Clostridiaceae bacterium]